MKKQLVILFLFGSIQGFAYHGNIDGEEQLCAEDSGSPRRTYDITEPCDTETNCLYEGKCIQIPRIDSLEPVVRFNLTSDIDPTFDITNDPVKSHPKGKVHVDRESEEKEFVAIHKCVCDGICTENDRTLAVVCGTDGKSYATKCDLKLTACRCQKGIFVQHQGRCFTDTKVFDITADDEDLSWGPSGSGDGSLNGYEQRCPSGVVCKFGAVCSDHPSDNGCYCNKVCPPPLFEEPAFGSDGKWYDSVCFLNKAECESQVSITHIADALPPLHDAVKHTAPSVDVCEGIHCFHGAICLPDEELEFTCSCEAICDEEFALPLPDQETPFRFLAAFLPEPLEMMFGSSTPEEPSTKESINRKEKPHLDIDPTEDSKIETLDGVSELKQVWKEEVEPFDDVDNDFAIYYQQQRDERRERRRRRQRRRRRRRGGWVHRSRTKRSVSNNVRRTYINETVCGTDGKTYSHECQMRVWACKQKIRIDVSHVGACRIPVPMYTSSVTTEEGLTAPLKEVIKEEVNGEREMKHTETKKKHGGNKNEIFDSEGGVPVDEIVFEESVSEDYSADDDMLKGFVDETSLIGENVLENVLVEGLRIEDNLEKNVKEIFNQELDVKLRQVENSNDNNQNSLKSMKSIITKLPILDEKEESDVDGNLKSKNGKNDPPLVGEDKNEELQNQDSNKLSKKDGAVSKYSLIPEILICGPTNYAKENQVHPIVMALVISMALGFIIFIIVTILCIRLKWRKSTDEKQENQDTVNKETDIKRKKNKIVRIVKSTC